MAPAEGGLYAEQDVWSRQQMLVSRPGEELLLPPLPPPKITVRVRHEADKYRVNLTREEAPAHVVYPHVLRGYRAGGDYRRCAAALFELHVETLNAWTMLAGGATSVALLATVAVAAPPPLSTAFLAPFILLTAAVLLHMPFSVGFHLFRGINADVYNLWRRLDQIFIFFASVLLALALSWHAYESAAAIALNTAAAAVVAVAAVREIVGLQPHYQRPRGAMVAFVGSIVMCYWWPMGVTAVRELAAGTPTAATWTALGTFAVLQAGGAAYACGFPERAFPGIFDVCMFSHQLMHVAALAAHVLEYCFVWSLATQSHGALSAAT